MQPTVFSALANFTLLALPALAYAGIVRVKSNLPWADIRDRIGLCAPKAPYFTIGLGLSLIGAGVTVAMTSLGIGFSDTASPIHFLVGQRPTSELLWAAFLYAFVATGPGEEVLFRGLIGGALQRRMRPWLANVLQSLIFTAPHALILLVRPELWVAIPVVFVLGCGLGVLRMRSNSVVPSALVHAFGNFGAAVSVLNW